MRRPALLTAFVTLALLAGAAHVAYAAYGPIGASCDPNNDFTCDPATSYCEAVQNSPQYATCVPKSQMAADTAQAQAAVDQQVGTAPPGSTAPTAPPLGSDTSSQLGAVMSWIMQLFAWLLGVAAIILDNTVYYTVVVMGNYIHNLAAVGVTWRILRDIGNILLIFGFLAAGIATILNLDLYGWSTKMLPKLLIAAVFLNFSLFISEAVIDVGNLFATEFYTQINGGAAPAPTSLSSLGNEGISNKIMGQLKFQAIYGATRTNSVLLSGSNAFIIGFMGSILFIVAAFVMFSLAFILIARFVALVFLIISAPIGFAGWAVPRLEKLSTSWWNQLFEQTITAPVLLLLLYIALAVITDANFLTGLGASSGDAWTGTSTSSLTAFGGMLLSFLVAMGLLIAVTISAKKMSAFGADRAMKLGGAVTFGATAYGMRYTAGLASNAAARKVRESKWLNSTGAGRLVGRRIAGAFDYGATANYHLGAGLAGAGVGIDFGKTHQGGYRAEKKATEEYKKSTEVAQQEARQRQRAKDTVKAGEMVAAQDRLLASAAITPATQARYDAAVATHNQTIVQNMAKMSTKELEELDGIKKGTEALVRNLSPQQFEALMKSDKLDDKQRDAIKQARYRTLSTAVGRQSVPDIKTAVSALSKGELESMPANLLADTNVLGNLSDKQRDTITDSKERTAAEKDLVRQYSKTGQVDKVYRDVARGGPAAAAAMLRNLTPVQVAKLKNDILTDPLIIDKFTPRTLVAIQDEKKLDDTEVSKISQHILAGAGPNSLRAHITGAGLGVAYWS